MNKPYILTYTCDREILNQSIHESYDDAMTSAIALILDATTETGRRDSFYDMLDVANGKRITIKTLKNKDVQDEFCEMGLYSSDHTLNFWANDDRAYDVFIRKAD